VSSTNLKPSWLTPAQSPAASKGLLSAAGPVAQPVPTQQKSRPENFRAPTRQPTNTIRPPPRRCRRAHRPHIRGPSPGSKSVTPNGIKRHIRPPPGGEAQGRSSCSQPGGEFTPQRRTSPNTGSRNQASELLQSAAVERSSPPVPTPMPTSDFFAPSYATPANKISWSGPGGRARSAAIPCRTSGGQAVKRLSIDVCPAPGGSNRGLRACR